jgi:hypothetical protein
MRGWVTMPWAACDRAAPSPRRRVRVRADGASPVAVRAIVIDRGIGGAMARL